MTPLDDALRDLTAPPAGLDDAVAALPRAPGLVVWWGTPSVLPGLVGDDTAPLVVGPATSLRNRVTRQDLYRTGVSWPRRVLAGLLLDELALAPTWAAEVVLPRADEDRLTAWMHAHLRLVHHASDARRELLEPVVAALGPVLREDGEPAASALARYEAAAGPKPVREVGVPFRRP